MKRLLVLLFMIGFITLGNAQLNCLAKIEAGKDPLKSGWNLTAVGKGTAPYTFLWSNGSKESKIYVEKGGEYCVTVVDAANCLSKTCYNVTSTSACSVEILNGSATGGFSAVAKGTAPFKYLWYGPNNFSSEAQTIFPTVSGVYGVTIVDANGCSSKASITYNAPKGCSVVITTSKTDNKYVLVANPTPQPNPGTIFKYLWSNGATTQTIAATEAGKYCVTVTNNEGCVATACTEIKLDGCSAAINVKVVGVGVWRLRATGTGKAPFKYQWSEGSTTPSIFVAIHNTYCVTITDAAGCKAVACVKIGNVIDPNNCGVIIQQKENTLTALAKGTAPFKYSWTGPNGYTSGDMVIKVIGPGTYCVVVTDAAGCISKACITIAPTSDCGVEIQQLQDPNSPAIKLYALAKGTAPFTYAWSNGSTAQFIIVQQSGEYCVTVTDAKGCVAKSCIKVTIGGNCGVTINIIPSNNGSTAKKLQAVPTGKAPFTYLWNTGQTTETIIVEKAGEYCVTVKDASGCIAKTCVKVTFDHACAVDIQQFPDSLKNYVKLLAKPTGTGPFTYKWNTGATSESILVEKTGEYCVTVTDSKGCIAVACTKVTIGAACGVSIQVTPYNNALTVKKLLALPTGKAPFKYLWSTGATTEFILVEKAGEYCVTVTDAAGCVAKSCIKVTFEGCTARIEVSQTPGTIGKKLIAVGTGVAPFKYLWSTGETAQFIYAKDSKEYCVTITDSKGCVAIACVKVSFETCTAKIEIVPSPISSSRTLVAVGTGIAPFKYLWSTGATTEKIEVKDNKEYCVTITDAAGCVAKACITLAPPPCAATILIDQLSNGVYVLEAVGSGKAPFTYNWTNGSTDKIIKTDAKGKEFCVVIVDANKCEAKACVKIPALIQDDIDTKSSQLINVDLFPNPVEDILHIRVNAGITTEVMIQVLDLSGKLVYTKSYDTGAEGLQIEIPSQNWHSGLYLVNILNAGEKKTYKVVKQ